jgi:hypothetical protein
VMGEIRGLLLVDRVAPVLQVCEYWTASGSSRSSSAWYGSEISSKFVWNLNSDCVQVYHMAFFKDVWGSTPT